MHYGTHPTMRFTPAGLIKLLGASSGVEVLEMQPGDKLDF
jgi:hypothetical protein